jgi:hypothetical protein
LFGLLHLTKNPNRLPKTAQLVKNCQICQKNLKMLTQKATQNVAICFGYFVLTKNHNELPKIAQWVQIAQFVEV